MSYSISCYYSQRICYTILRENALIRIINRKVFFKHIHYIKRYIFFVKKDSCYMKFTQYTAEEDIINVIFSLINAG